MQDRLSQNDRERLLSGAILVFGHAMAFLELLNSQIMFADNSTMVPIVVGGLGLAVAGAAVFATRSVQEVFRGRQPVDNLLILAIITSSFLFGQKKFL